MIEGDGVLVEDSDFLTALLLAAVLLMDVVVLFAEESGPVEFAHFGDFRI